MYAQWPTTGTHSVMSTFHTKSRTLYNFAIDFFCVSRTFYKTRMLKLLLGEVKEVPSRQLTLERDRTLTKGRNNN